MGDFSKKIDNFIHVFIDQNGYVKVLEGLQNTLLIAILGLIIGILIGTIIAIVRVLPKYKLLPRILNAICSFYVGAFRGTPIVVQLLVFYYVLLPILGINISGVNVSILVFGLNSGTIPIIAYNYGAGKRERVIKTMKLGAVYAIGILSFGTLVFQLFSAPLLALFDASETMLSIGQPALRIISLSFPLAGACIAMGSAFQAMGRATYSMLTSIARQLVVLLPAAFVLSRFDDVNLVWWAYPIAEIMSTTITTIFVIKLNKEVISKIGQGHR